MPQIQINGETFDVFIVRNGEAAPVPIEMTVIPRTPGTTASIASTTSSTTIVAANTQRKGVSIYNNSTALLYLSFATPATTANAFMVMQPQSLVMLDQQLIVTSAIYGLWSAVNGTAQVTEFS